MEQMNLSPYIKKRLIEALKHESPEVQDVYRGASTMMHRKMLDGIVAELLEKYQLKLRLARILNHHTDHASPE